MPRPLESAGERVRPLRNRGPLERCRGPDGGPGEKTIGKFAAGAAAVARAGSKIHSVGSVASTCTASGDTEY